MSNKSTEVVKKEITSRVQDVDFSKLPAIDELQSIKVKPKARLFNSLMTLIMTTIAVCLGVIVGLVIAHFA